MRQILHSELSPGDACAACSVYLARLAELGLAGGNMPKVDGELGGLESRDVKGSDPLVCFSMAELRRLAD